MVSTYWNPFIHELDPYVPGEQPKDKTYIKLNTNESPYPPSPKVLEAIREATNADLRLYPDPHADGLRKQLADYYGVKTEQIFVGNGSDEVLAFAFQALFAPDKPILFPDVSYSFYPVYAKMFRLEAKTIPLSEDFTLSLKAFDQPNGGIIFPNPNAPTGKAIRTDEIEELLIAQRDRVVIVDEAYVDFGAASMIPLIHKHPNLLVIQTTSKSRSLAGLRVGFAIGDADLIEALNRVKNCFNSYTLDRLALAGATAAFADEAYFQETTKAIIATRGVVVKELQALGFTVIPSQSNFVFISHPTVPASTLFARCKEAGVLVRYFRLPRIDNYLRVTIGLDSEMQQFLATVAKIVNQEKAGGTHDL